MSKTRISDLRDTIARLEERIDVLRHVGSEDMHMRRLAETKLAHARQVIELKDETIAALREALAAEKRHSEVVQSFAVGIVEGAKAKAASDDGGTWEVWMHHHGAKKIYTIKALRAITDGLKLKAAKDLSESFPCQVFKGTRARCEEAASALKSAGADVEVRRCER